MSSWHPARSGPRLPDLSSTAITVLAFALVGAAAGFLIARQSIIPILLLFGMVAGVVMLNALPMVVWIVIAGTLVITGPVMVFLPQFETIGWLFSLLGFFLAIAALLYAAIGKRRYPLPAPAFVMLAVALLVFGALSMLYSGDTLGDGVRAFKRYYQFFGVLFVLAVVPFPSRLVGRWWQFLMVIGLLQLPFALYQYVFLVPAREGVPGVVPIDIIVGTMEGLMNAGGNNGTLVYLLVITLAFAVAALRDRVITTPTFLALAAAATAPIALGDVAFAVALLPLGLLAVTADVIRRSPGRFLLGILVLLPVLAIAGWAYLAAHAYTGQLLDEKIADILAYNIGTVGYFGSGLNRTTALTYWWAHHSLATDPVSTLFGHGLGASYGPLGSLETGHMDQAHNGMFIGLTAASAILWDLGLVGLLLLLAQYGLAATCAYRLGQSARPGLDRAVCRSLFAAVLLLPLMLLYSYAPISAPSQELLAALCLGLIAWRARSGQAFAADADLPVAAPSPPPRYSGGGGA
jgi:hypothetical protein